MKKQRFDHLLRDSQKHILLSKSLKDRPLIWPLLQLFVCSALCLSLGSFVLPREAEAATAKIINSDFSYGASNILNCSTCQWAYLDLNNKRFATGQDCPIHTQKNTWLSLPFDFDPAQFGWKSSQRDDESSTWENGVVSQVANCVEIQQESNGNYYAELTADEKNTYIYQDISTEPGAIYKWSLKHASRASDSLDSMSVMIGSPDMQIAQHASRTSVNGLGDKTGNVGTVIATPSSRSYNESNNRISVQWESYSGTYIIPPGQTQTRFTFKAIVSRNANSGNLVDDISFTRSYALNYDLTGGTSTLIYNDASEQNYLGYHSEGSTVTLTSAQPVRTGYTFLGWSRARIPDVTDRKAYEAIKESLISDLTMPSTATTVYAVWASNPLITFVDGVGTTIVSQAVPFGESATAPSDPVRLGYTFVKWDTSFANVYSDLIVTANWEPHRYTISFRPNSGIGSMEEELFFYHKPQKLNLNQFERKGYLFTGWNTHPDGSGKAYTNEQEVVNLSSEDGATITLYAQWEPVNYFVAFDANGGAGTMLDQQLTFDHPDTLQEVLFKRTGFRWVRWDTNPSVPEASYADQALVENLAERANEIVTLYAVWSANRCLIVYDSNGGNGTMRAQSLAYGSAEQLYPHAFQREGYHWVGWNTEPDGSGTSFSDEQSVQDLSTIDNSTIILYALWEKDSSEPGSETQDPDPGMNDSDPSQGANEPDPEPDTDEPLPDPEPDMDEPGLGTNDTDPGSEFEEEDPSILDNEADQPSSEEASLSKQADERSLADGQQKSLASFAKTGESIMPLLCIALVLLAGGVAFLIEGRRRRKRLQDRKRQLFRSFLEP